MSAGSGSAPTIEPSGARAVVKPNDRGGYDVFLSDVCLGSVVRKETRFGLRRGFTAIDWYATADNGQRAGVYGTRRDAVAGLIRASDPKGQRATNNEAE